MGSGPPIMPVWVNYVLHANFVSSEKQTLVSRCWVIQTERAFAFPSVFHFAADFSIFSDFCSGLIGF
jgi:hypothetical protein